jgi:phosphoribosylglycinamide formyltransferase-1
VVTNKEDAYVRQRAERLGVDCAVVTGKDMRDEGRVKALLDDYGVDFCVLAGYLLLVPQYIIKYFNGDVVNIHPALLPKHGGKGMYGDRVHADVLACGDEIIGITVHYIDEQFDRGRTIMQAFCPVLANDTVESLAQRIHKLEYAYFPAAIECVLKS